MQKWVQHINEVAAFESGPPLKGGVASMKGRFRPLTLPESLTRGLMMT